MNERGQTSNCSRCGAPVDPDALRGLCPRCLIALNLAATTQNTGEDQLQTERAKARPGPVPSPEEIAALFPQLQILECLGCGGMGAVYKARQPKLDRFVALKILLKPAEGSPGETAFAERFAREARALARLNCPEIVAVYDYGEAGKYPFLVMEYVDGLSLRQLLQRGALKPEEALSIVPKLCQALQYAHSQGIIHRDIKPENILLDKQGRIKIADFGIAKIVAPGRQDSGLTGAHDIMGTPHYMAPEQIERPDRVDHRADIFSLGVVFYEMLTGELPLGKFAPPSHKVHVDLRLDEVVLRALEKEPERRYQQAKEVKTAVETITRAQAVGPTAQPAWRAPSREWLGYAGLALACLSGVLGTRAWASMPDPPQPLVWSILFVAIGGILLSFPARLSGAGKAGMILGALNVAVWLMVAAESERIHSAFKSATVVAPAVGWGEPSDGLEMSLAEARPGGAQGTTLEVRLRNAGGQDVQLILGSSLNNGRIQLPQAISLSITDRQGQTQRLEFANRAYPGVAGRVDDFVVALPAGATYTLQMALDEFWCPATREHQLQFTNGPYRLRAQLAGRGPAHLNSDTAGLGLAQFWRGRVESNPIEIQPRPKMGAPGQPAPPAGWPRMRLEGRQAGSGYVVVYDDTPAGRSYKPVAEALAGMRNAAQISLAGEGFEGVFEQLRARRPAFVAFVVPPERVEDNFVGEVFDRASRLDNEPDLDFAYGFITGATPEDAMLMVRNTSRAEADRAGIPKKFVAIGQTFPENDLGPFAREQALLHEAYGYRAEAINPVDASSDWEKRLPAEIRKLDGASLVFAAGHGMGDRLCGIDADAFSGFQLDRAILVLGPCHSAVTLLRHDNQSAPLGVKTVAIPAERSICLKLIRAGAIAQLGSTASSSWMNVALALPGFFNEGKTVGEALRDRLNDHIRQQRIDRFSILPFQDGEPSPQFLRDARNAGQIQSISRVVLIGDPAYRPFPEPRPRLAPPRPHPVGSAAATNNDPPAASAPGAHFSGATIAQLLQALPNDTSENSFPALNELVRRGPGAVPALLEALKTSESWLVPKALGAIKDPRAVKPLIQALEQRRLSPYKDVAAEALQLITGQKFGDDPAAWADWQETTRPIGSGKP